MTYDDFSRENHGFKFSKSLHGGLRGVNCRFIILSFLKVKTGIDFFINISSRSIDQDFIEKYGSF
jgi:hypothetical protein